MTHRVLAIARHADGHRREYVLLFQAVFAAAGVRMDVADRVGRQGFTRDPLFFLMIEEGSDKFFLWAFVRALLGRRTTGLLFRGRECLDPATLRTRAKRLALSWLKPAPGFNAVSILPFSAEPRLRELASAAIHDPQLWDLHYLKLDEARAELASEIRRAAAGRKVLVALGAQNASKGFDYLAQIWSESSEIRSRFLFVSAGKCAEASGPAAEAFREAGGLLIDRFVDDAEMHALYGCADLVWSCYAPDYDQASGIFGRAVQHGVPAVIRDRAYLGALAEEASHPAVPIPWDAPARAAEALLQADVAPTPPDSSIASRTESMRASSLESLFQALGLNAQRRAA